MGAGQRPGGAVPSGGSMRWRGRIERVLALVRGRQLDRELEAEVEAHLEMAERDARKAGLSAEEARWAARQRFGGIEQMKEEHRDRRSVRWIETWVRDFRIAVRTLGRAPSFVVVTVLTLALGIGATAAVFSLIQGVLLTPPPYRDPEQLVLIPSARTDGQRRRRRGPGPPRNGSSGSARRSPFESIAAYRWTFNFLILPEGSESLEGMGVTPEYFSVIGLEPVLGRAFTVLRRQTVRPPRHHHRLRTLAAQVRRRSRHRRQTDPHQPPGAPSDNHRRDAAGRPLPAGAAAARSRTTTSTRSWTSGCPSAWIRSQGTASSRDGISSAACAPGVTPEQAQAELALLTARQAQADRDFDGFTPNVQSLTSEFNRDGERILLPLFGAAALVLLIACGNVAALLLVRGLGRQQEYAVRSRPRRRPGWRSSARPPPKACCSLSLGGALGAGLAFGVVRGLQADRRTRDSATRRRHHRLARSALRPRPGAHRRHARRPLPRRARASRLDPIEVLKSAGPEASSAGRGERRLLRAVTMAQTALTLVLLVGAGLLIRTMINIANAPIRLHTSTHPHDDASRGARRLGRISSRARWSASRRCRASSTPPIAWGVPLTGNNWPARVDHRRPAGSRESE